MHHTVIQVGNSKALIIPAKIVRKKGFNSHTRFDIIETEAGFNVVALPSSIDQMEFPRVEKPVVSEKVKSLTGLVKFSSEEIEADDRLKHLLQL